MSKFKSVAEMAGVTAIVTTACIIVSGKCFQIAKEEENNFWGHIFNATGVFAAGVAAITMNTGAEGITECLRR